MESSPFTVTDHPTTQSAPAAQYSQPTQPEAPNPNRLVLNAYRNLMRDLLAFTSQEERKQVRRAFEVAAKAHASQRRKSGEPYILHPIAVARIVVREIGLKDYIAVQAALLHDTVEDTELTLSFVKRQFGPRVAAIVDGLTKINGIFDLTTTTSQAETYRKMLLTLSDDVRVALVKIADRLHNLRTLDAMKREKQLKVAAETEQVYAPLAGRFGLERIKAELDDIVLSVTEPAAYAHLVQHVADTKASRDRFIKQFVGPLRRQLDQLRLSYRIKSRVKAASSIWRKMQRQGIGFEEVYDVFAVRIILDSPGETQAARNQDCWRVYNALTARYRPHPTRLRDWISQPRPSGYQALHCTVMGPGGRWVEVQIRTQEMDEAAEKGVAAHWKYKDGKSGELSRQDQAMEHWLAKMRELLENQELNAKDFVNEVRNSLQLEQIYVFTPKGELKILPKGATALDFAYAIHTQIGNTCIGAKVNQSLTGQGHVLRNGDQVEALTSQKQQPEENWLNMVQTPRARHKIREALKDRYKEIAARGEELFVWKTRQWGIGSDHQAVRELLAEFSIPTLTELYYRIGSHQIDVQRLSDFIKRKLEKREVYESNPTPEAYGKARAQELEDLIRKLTGVDSDTLFVKGDLNTSQIHLATCCSPIPGDEIIGVARPEQGVQIHRANCPEAKVLMSTYGQQLVKVTWSEDKEVEFLAAIKVVGQDTKCMMSKLVRVISTKQKLNIRSITIDSKQGAFDGIFKVYVRNTRDVDRLIKELLQVKGVHGATRVGR